jgi:ankyrin repeat protein
MFLSKNTNERTAWHMAIEEGQTELLHKLWAWAEDLQTPEDLKTMFLDKDEYKTNAWHIAPLKGQIELVHEI